MPKKRSNGEGSFRKRPNGQWEYAIMIDCPETGKRKRKSFYARTQREAREKANRYYEEQKNAQPAFDGSMTFQTWAETWFANYKDQVAASTYDGYRYTLNKLETYFGSMKLSDIRTAHIEEYFRLAQKSGLSASYLAKFRGLMYQILNKAAANDLITKNPVQFADKLHMKKPVQPKETFHANEIEQLMVRLPQDRSGWSIRLMLGTGIRTQELLGLEVKHIAPDGSSLKIEQAVSQDHGKAYLGPPKSRSGYRDIPIPEKLRYCAVALRDNAIQNHRSFIWYSTRGTDFINPSCFRNYFRREIAAAGINRHLTPHCCRHTYVSQLQAQNVSLETIQALTGHADVDMTRHYLHVQSEVKLDAVSRLNQIL